LVTGLISVRLSTAEQADVRTSEDSEQSPASTPPASSSDSSAEDRMNVSGVVLDEEGQRIAGASVTLRVAPHAFGSLMLNETYQEVLANTQSDEQGRFRFDNVLIPEPFRRHRPSPNRFPYDVIVDTKTHGLGWALFREKQMHGLEVRLQPRSQLSGTIVNAAGEPLPDALVSVNAISKASATYDPFAATHDSVNFLMSRKPPETRTNADGQFVFEQVPLDSLVAISVRHNDYASMYALVAVGPGAEPKTYGKGPHQITAIGSPARLTLQPGLKLDVRVVRDGRPVSGPAKLHGMSAYIEPIEVKPGRYRTAVRDAGQYYLYVADAEREMTVSVPLTLEAKHLESPLTQTMTIPPTRALTGRVVVKETGQPLAGLRVQWSQSDAERQQSYMAAVTTDAQGQFTIQVVPGTGKLSLSGESSQALVLDPANLRTNSPPPGYYHDVDVPTEGSVQPVMLEVSQGLQIVGKLQDAAGKPLADQRVSIIPLGWSIEDRRETMTDREGRYMFAGLSPQQTYSLSAHSSEFVARAVVQEDTSASLVDSTRKQVDLTARPSVTLVGRVLEDQQPVAGVEVELTVGHPVGDDGMSYQQVATARTDAQGNYRLAGLWPGDVYQVSTNLTHRFDPRWRYGSPYHVTLPSDGQDEFELDDMHLVRYEQTLAGQVVDPDGQPVSGATVLARMVDGQIVYRVGELPPPWTETDADGRFELQSLPNQVLKLMAHIRTSDQGGPVRFPAEVKTQLNQRDVRILLDPSLLEE
jgi:protocatechuate 3,4-dioxygenase beta subunit